MIEAVSKVQLEKLVNSKSLEAFESICEYIENAYEMDKTWNDGGKKWDYECKYRKSGKTLCAFYFKEGYLGILIIFGKDERIKVEGIRDELSIETITAYDEAQTYHDGKWVMFELEGLSQLDDMKKLLLIKRRPKKK